jgi:anaerobic magnesium-protoporphyrin IX monomethyl ester cyclase
VAVKVALIGAELEENLALRYMASALEARGHDIEIIPFNSQHDISRVVGLVSTFSPQITGLSMVFTGRAREFCALAEKLRQEGYSGHLIAGGHFAAFNCEHLLSDFAAFDSIALGEGEETMCRLAEDPGDLSRVPGLCYRKQDGSPVTSSPHRPVGNLDLLHFPKRTSFHDYFNKPIASILSSRGCWRNCSFCSINAWYEKGQGKKYRYRSEKNIIAEMKDLYHRYGVRIFNFQDDNFFFPDPHAALKRFERLRTGLLNEGAEKIAIAIKARPDSITRESIDVLKDLGLFRVFLGVENASENGLSHLNRKCTREQIVRALEILNDFDVHVAYNFLLFEPDTIMDDILVNLRFIEKHMENPFNFCRAEAYAGTGLEAKLRKESLLLGDYFGLDYRLKDASTEAFHQIANYAFFDRNFSDFGLHYFNMQVDFYFHVLKRFHPDRLTESLRGAVRNFIKRTNLDTYQFLGLIYDFITANDPHDRTSIWNYARELRVMVDERSRELHALGESILKSLDSAYEHGKQKPQIRINSLDRDTTHPVGSSLIPYEDLDSLKHLDSANSEAPRFGTLGPFNLVSAPIPYHQFRRKLDKVRTEEQEGNTH